MLKLFVAGILCLGATLHCQQPSVVSSIEIESGWGGLGTPQDLHVSIHCLQNRCRSRSAKVPIEKVQALSQALAEHMHSKPDLDDLGITKSWLAQRAQVVSIPQYQGTPELTPRQKLLFRKTFMDRAIVESLIAGIYASSHTDDYPYVRVDILMSDGRKSHFESEGQSGYLLPWKINSDGVEVTAFNSDISKAVAAMLPLHSANQGRLANEDFGYALAESVARRIEDQINLIGVEDRSGEALKTLRSKYKVRTAEINGFHHAEYGQDWKHGDPGVRNLHVTLHRQGDPENVVVLLVLPVVDGVVSGLETFMDRGDVYENSVTNDALLLAYAKAHPTTPLRVSYVDGSSLGDKGWSTFSSDMKAIGRENLLAEIAPIRSQVSLLIIGITYAESYWLLMPDGRLLLWRYGGPSGLLGRKSQEFATKECALYGTVTGGCVGEYISR